MGTSSRYGGPKGKNPLLPIGFGDDNAIDNEEGFDNKDNVDEPLEKDKEAETDKNGNEKSDPKEEKQNYETNKENIVNNLQTQDWKNAKNSISKYIKNSSTGPKKAVSRYVKALGGANKASKASHSGKTTTIKLGSFLSNVSSTSVKETFDNLKIDYIGKDVKVVLSELVNKLSPVPINKEDSVAREALIDALEILYDETMSTGEDIDKLNNLTQETFNLVMKTYVSSYIFQRLLNDLESRFEIYSKDTKTALEIESQIKEYIKSDVENKLNENKLSNLNFNSIYIQKDIEKIYTDCYQVLEGTL